MCVCVCVYFILYSFYLSISFKMMLNDSWQWFWSTPERNVRTNASVRWSIRMHTHIHTHTQPGSYRSIAKKDCRQICRQANERSIHFSDFWLTHGCHQLNELLTSSILVDMATVDNMTRENCLKLRRSSIEIAINRSSLIQIIWQRMLLLLLFVLLLMMTLWIIRVLAFRRIHWTHSYMKIDRRLSSYFIVGQK